MRNPGARTSSSWMPAVSTPPADQLEAAAAVLNAGSRVAVLAGQGALSAREESDDPAFDTPELVGRYIDLFTRAGRKAASRTICCTPGLGSWIGRWWRNCASTALR